MLTSYSIGFEKAQFLACFLIIIVLYVIIIVFNPSETLLEKSCQVKI